MDLRDWLLGDDAAPAIRWQVMADLTDSHPDAVAAERARVATEGWGARLLALQGDDGLWDGGSYDPSWLTEEWFETHDGQPWTGTMHVLKLLRELGVDPAAVEMQRAIGLVHDKVLWDHDDERFFDGEVEECINGTTLAVGATYGVDVAGIVDWIEANQQSDGGWNCDRSRGATTSSFHSVICIVEGLLAFDQATGGTPASRRLRAEGEEFMLARGLMRRRSTGEPIDSTFQQFSFPTRWFYDVLRGLDHFRSTGAAPDPRLAEALQLVRDKRRPDGTWALENTHPGDVPFELEDGDGSPSRWNTLRALRVLRWAGDEVSV